MHHQIIAESFCRNHLHERNVITLIDRGHRNDKIKVKTDKKNIIHVFLNLEICGRYLRDMNHNPNV